MTTPHVITLVGKITATLPSGETATGSASITGRSTRDSGISAKQAENMRSALLKLLVSAVQLAPQTKGYSCPCYPAPCCGCSSMCNYSHMDTSITSEVAN